MMSKVGQVCIGNDRRRHKGLVKQYLLYLMRWQLSTPIIALCIVLLPFSPLVKAIIANVIGGVIFFWVDRWIFK